jgi:hypothetical protein
METRDAPLSHVSAIVISKVNAPYATQVDITTLAAAITNVETAKRYLGPTYAFFTELPVGTKTAFVDEHKLDPDKVDAVATYLSKQAGHTVSLKA